MFRTAIKSGLPITMRRNHSYRVSYYEPAGTDAAVYDPWPDVRFLNDTNNHILIQTRIEGDDIYFDFWGTKDGRIVEKTDPVIYNITRPGPTKTIETLDLPVGVKKCTERAHNGADAYFDYKVTYPISEATTTPEIKEERFSSHYVPWQEVCLIGVEKLLEEETETIKNDETAKDPEKNIETETTQ
jgi:vancomycin resistance protein YoaR